MPNKNLPPKKQDYCQIRQINQIILLNIILIITSLLLINYTNLDKVIQDHFFDFKTGKWLINKDEPIKKIVFYILPKIALGFLLLISLLALIPKFSWRFLKENRSSFILLLCGLSLIIPIAANIKKFTNVYCPNQLTIYGGTYPYVKILENYPADFKADKPGRCFPGGHAVTGFSLLILFFIFKRRSYKLISLLGVTALGWALGLYQMMKGVHFFGDTLLTMWVCFLLAALVARLFIYYNPNYLSDTGKR